jgi:hypothetical protein
MQRTNLSCSEQSRYCGEAGEDCNVEDGAVHLAKDRAVHQGEDGADCHVWGGAVHLAKDRVVHQGEDGADCHVEDGAVRLAQDKSVHRGEFCRLRPSAAPRAVQAGFALNAPKLVCPGQDCSFFLSTG